MAPAMIVNTLLDEDDGLAGGGTGLSLREAVKYSPAGSTILFDVALSGQTIRLTRGNLSVENSLTIDCSLLPARITLSADRTGNGKTADDTYVILLNAGNLVLDSLILADANVGESKGCISTSRTDNPSLYLDHCTFIGNSGYHSGAIHMIGGNLTISNSTFSENSAIKGGSAFTASRSVVSIQNSTFSKNSGLTIFSSGGRISLNHTTIAGNSSSKSGPALHHTGTSIFSLSNSIVTGNPLASQPNVSGTFIGSNNLISGTPLLAPLGDYGGPTQTMVPLPESPTINGGDGSAINSDQRGFPRVSPPDIGAVEFRDSDIARIWNLDFDGDGSPYGLEQALGTNNFTPDSKNSRNLTSPSFNASGHAILKFGLNSTSIHGTRWILKRSPDLSHGSYTEIYRTNGLSDTVAPGFEFIRGTNSVTVFDENPLARCGFYRFEATLEP